MIEDLLGRSLNTDLTPLQMGLRSLLAFIAALIFIRMAGIRAFGMKSSFDNIIILLLGAILSHVVINDSPLIGVLVSSLVIVLLHRLFGIIAIYSDAFGKLVKGDKTLLLKDGKEIPKNMKRSMITRKDLSEGIRMTAHTDKHENVEAAYLERSGHISVVTKESNKPAD